MKRFISHTWLYCQITAHVQHAFVLLSFKHFKFKISKKFKNSTNHPLDFEYFIQILAWSRGFIALAPFSCQCGPEYFMQEVMIRGTLLCRKSAEKKVCSFLWLLFKCLLCTNLRKNIETVKRFLVWTSSALFKQPSELHLVHGN